MGLGCDTMNKSNLVFGSILTGLGIAYGLNALSIIGDGIFSIAFLVLIILVPALTEHYKIGSSREYIVKGIFAGCLLLTIFLDLGLVFNLIMAGVIVLSGIIMMMADNIKKLLEKRGK